MCLCLCVVLPHVSMCCFRHTGILLLCKMLGSYSCVRFLCCRNSDIFDVEFSKTPHVVFFFYRGRCVSAIDVMDGWARNRCDDLESLGYVIVSMLKEGSTALPWSGSTSVASGLAAKKKTTLEELCQDCPAGMLEYMEAVRSMGYQDVPGYDRLDKMLQSMENDGAAAGRGAGGARRSTASKTNTTASAGNKGASGKRKTASVAKRTKGRSATKTVASEEEEEEVEVCDAKAKGKGKAAKTQRGSTAATAAKGTPVPASPKQRTATAAVRRSRRLSSPKDGEEFFDALQEHDSNEGDEELEVTKVVRGAAATGTGKKSASSKAKASAKPKGVFLAEVSVYVCFVWWVGAESCRPKLLTWLYRWNGCIRTMDADDVLFLSQR